jgi:hypothetical protein
MDTRVYGGYAFDDLKPEWDVVDCELSQLLYLYSCNVVDILNMYWDEPIQMVAKKAEATLRYFRMRGGTVAVFGSHI